MTTSAHAWRIVLASSSGVSTMSLSEDEPFSLAPGVELTARGGRLDLRVDPRGPVRALLNDVQVAGFANLHPGDQLEVPGTTALVQRVSAISARTGPVFWRRDEFQTRLWSESARAREQSRALAYGLVRVRAGESSAPPALVHLELSPLGAGMFEALVIGAGESVRAAVEAWASGNEGCAAWALQPEDGGDLDALVAAALSRFDPAFAIHTEEPLAADPSTVRLRALLDRLAHEPGNIVFVGERSTGRASWARFVQAHSAQGQESRVELDAAGRLPLPSRDELEGRVVLVRNLDALPTDRQREWLDACAQATRILATAEAPLEDSLRARVFQNEVFVPALRDRPAEILPLATQALERARRALKRPGLSFNAEVRSALQAYAWPGNVRELINAVLLAALSAESDELRPAHLPPQVTASWQRGRRNAGAAEDLRSSLKAAEKDALLKVLARTSWNVTKAAKELGLPRRTVVYRMAKLGLKRPGR